MFVAATTACGMFSPTPFASVSSRPMLIDNSSLESRLVTCPTNDPILFNAKGMTPRSIYIPNYKPYKCWNLATLTDRSSAGSTKAATFLSKFGRARVVALFRVDVCLTHERWRFNGAVHDSRPTSASMMVTNKVIISCIKIGLCVVYASAAVASNKNRTVLALLPVEVSRYCAQEEHQRRLR